MGKGGKSRNLALTGIEEEIDGSKNEDDDNDEDEDLTFIADEIGKRIRTNFLGNLNPLGWAKMRNLLSSAISANVLVI